MQRRLLSLLLLLLPLAVLGQTVLKGTVTNEKKQPVQNAVVKLMQKGRKAPLTYAYTNEKGNYQLSYSSAVGSNHLLVFSCMGYQTAERAIQPQTTTYNATLTTREYTFKEATVKAPPIRAGRDTITYNVSALQQKSDRNIEDVIRRIPGVEIAGDGEIKYNGKDINRFYIEGVNLLDGNYRMATRNIRPDDIRSIDVLERHQPYKVLKDFEISDQAALNLKLKKGSLSRPIGNATAGVGVGDNAKWLAELYLMFISKKWQSIVTAKGNNFGDSYQGEATDLFESSSSRGIAHDFFSDTPFGTAPLPSFRYRKNRAAFVSVNGITQTASGNSLRVNANYAFDRNEFDHREVREYHSLSTPIVVQDEMNNLLRKQNFDVKLSWEANQENYYFGNVLKVNSVFRRNEYTLPSVVQNNAANDVSLSDNFQWVRRKGKRLLSFNVLAGFDNTPYARMRATDWQEDTAMIYQKVGGMLGYAAVSTSLKYLLGKDGKAGTVSVGLSAQGRYEAFDSEHPLPYEPSARNDNSLLSATLAVSPSYQVQTGILRFYLSLPVTYDYMHFRDKGLNTNHTFHRPYCSPSMGLTFGLNDYSSIDLSTGLYTMSSGFSDFILAPIYRTYRQQSALGTGDRMKSRSWSSMLSFIWQDIMKGQNFQFFVNYSRHQTNLMSSSSISDNGDERSRLIGTENVSHQWMANFNGKVYFLPLSTSFRLRGTASLHRSSMMRQE